MVAATLVFATWIGVYGLGAAKPGARGAALGLFAGLVWGGIFSFVYSRILWLAFEAPEWDDSAELEQIMHTDIGILLSRSVGRLRSFRPKPGFVCSGILPWTILLAAIILPMIWAYAFCQLTWLTEGAPGVEPVMPIDR
jgi:hypothetical protein